MPRAALNISPSSAQFLRHQIGDVMLLDALEHDVAGSACDCSPRRVFFPPCSRSFSNSHLPFPIRPSLFSGLLESVTHGEYPSEVNR
jgi:hypothetical protein